MVIPAFYQDIPLKLRKSLRAKYTSFKIRQGEVILTVPELGCVVKALEFLNSHREYVTTTLEKQRRINYEHASVLPLLGREYTVIYNAGLKNEVLIGEGSIIVSGNKTTAKARLKIFLVSFLRQKTTELALQYGKQIGVGFNKIIIRTMLERWASCTSRGHLLFSTKLAFTPLWVLEYVVAHEVCHLQEMNHGKKFWHLVDSIYPNKKAARLWLKSEGRYIM